MCWRAELEASGLDIRAQVRVQPERLVCRSWFSQSAVARDKIVSIDLRSRNEGESGYRYFPTVSRTDGTITWINLIDCGGLSDRTVKHLDTVNMIRSVLGVGGRDEEDL